MKRYELANNKLGDAQMLNTLFKTLVGINIGVLFTDNSFWQKFTVFSLGAICVIGLNLTQKYIDLNSPSKEQAKLTLENNDTKGN